MIHKYLDLLEVEGKSFALLAIAPNDLYPEKSYGECFESRR
ncbi:hypothetical protein [Paenibacillus alginolyticus]|nr:hypothetical protein [Paenibacillus frigoriresistens]